MTAATPIAIAEHAQDRCAADVPAGRARGETEAGRRKLIDGSAPAAPSVVRALGRFLGGGDERIDVPELLSVGCDETMRPSTEREHPVGTSPRHRGIVRDDERA